MRWTLIGLVGVSLLWGAVAAWTVAQHTSAADDVVTTIEPLSVDAQQIYCAPDQVLMSTRRRPLGSMPP